MTLGNRVKQVRKTANLKQKDFAERLTVSPSYISKVEADKEIPTDMLLKLIALEFNLSFDWLKEGKGEPSVKKGMYDYFERPNLEGFHSGNIDALSKAAQILQTSPPTEMDVYINGLIAHFQIISEKIGENKNFQTIVFDNVIDIVVSYTELISKLQDLEVNEPSYVNKVFSAVRMATVDIEEKLIELGELYKKKADGDSWFA